MDAVAYLIVGVVTLFAVLSAGLDAADLVQAGRGHRHRADAVRAEALTFDNYVTLWQRSGFPRLMTNSAVVTRSDRRHLHDLRGAGRLQHLPLPLPGAQPSCLSSTW